MDPKVMRSTSTGGCIICQNWPELSHKCMFEPHNARYVTAGVSPENKRIFNWYLANEAAKSDPEIRTIVREELYRKSIRPKLSQLVVPSYNRIVKVMDQLPKYVPKKLIRSGNLL